MKTISPCFQGRSNFYNFRGKKGIFTFLQKAKKEKKKKKKKNELEISRTGVSRFQLIMGPVGLFLIKLQQFLIVVRCIHHRKNRQKIGKIPRAGSTGNGTASNYRSIAIGRDRGAGGWQAPALYHRDNDIRDAVSVFAGCCTTQYRGSASRFSPPSPPPSSPLH